MLDSRNVKKFEDFIELSAGFFSERKIAESSPTLNGFMLVVNIPSNSQINHSLSCPKVTLLCRVDNKKADSRKGSEIPRQCRCQPDLRYL
jgi:hypothetical protein